MAVITIILRSLWVIYTDPSACKWLNKGVTLFLRSLAGSWDLQYHISALNRY